ncbi:hypothetical protein BD414DRAFT_571085 [Trametes punicea]|nr:hypothetical protein BD414DRAFT_571085 [Trametes punicea]
MHSLSDGDHRDAISSEDDGSRWPLVDLSLADWDTAFYAIYLPEDSRFTPPGLDDSWLPPLEVESQAAQAAQPSDDLQGHSSPYIDLSGPIHHPHAVPFLASGSELVPPYDCYAAGTATDPGGWPAPAQEQPGFAAHCDCYAAGTATAPGGWPAPAQEQPGFAAHCDTAPTFPSSHPTICPLSLEAAPEPSLAAFGGMDDVQPFPQFGGADSAGSVSGLGTLVPPSTDLPELSSSPLSPSSPLSSGSSSSSKVIGSAPSPAALYAVQGDWEGHTINTTNLPECGIPYGVFMKTYIVTTEHDEKGRVCKYYHCTQPGCKKQRRTDRGSSP